MHNNLSASFGDIDIYLFDQLLKGTYNNCTTIIDIGCGKGRNSHYFLRNNYNVFGIDPDPQAIATTRQLAQQLAPHLPSTNFIVAPAEEMPFAPATFDLAICSAVLHFAHNTAHFERMLYATWQALKPGGYFFVRLASSIGIETLITPTHGGRYLLPDGSERYLVTHQALLHYTHTLNAHLHEPLKTTNVNNLRAMTTWCLRKE